jgi:hypothetical protein
MALPLVVYAIGVLWEPGGHRHLFFCSNRSALATALAAFPESAAEEWRVACGSKDCLNLDHKIKFQMCQGCKVLCYCAVPCQKKDWVKRKAYCRAGR